MTSLTFRTECQSVFAEHDDDLSVSTWLDMHPAYWGVAPDSRSTCHCSPHSHLSGVRLRTKKCLVSLSPAVTRLRHRLKPLYSKYVGLVYTTEITSDPRHLPYSAHWAGFVAPVVQEWKALHRERQRVSKPPHNGHQVSQLHSAPVVHSEDEGFSEDDLHSLYPLPTSDDFHRLSKRSNKALLSALHTLYPRLMGARQWAELNVRP